VFLPATPGKTACQFCVEGCLGPPHAVDVHAQYASAASILQGSTRAGTLGDADRVTAAILARPPRPRTAFAAPDTQGGLVQGRNHVYSAAISISRLSSATAHRYQAAEDLPTASFRTRTISNAIKTIGAILVHPQVVRRPTSNATRPIKSQDRSTSPGFMSDEIETAPLACVVDARVARPRRMGPGDVYQEPDDSSPRYSAQGGAQSTLADQRNQAQARRYWPSPRKLRQR